MNHREEPEQTSAWRAFLWAPELVTRRLERKLLADTGLPLPWFDVLIHLYEAPERRLRFQALADSVVLSRSGLTRLVDRMEAAGLVRREPAPGDRRGLYAVLTQQGKERFEEVIPGHRRDVDEHFTRHLTEEELDTLAALLSKVIAANEDDGA